MEGGQCDESPFGNDSFDVVASRFGHMFPQNPEVAIREMLWVLKRGAVLHLQPGLPNLSMESWLG